MAPRKVAQKAKAKVSWHGHYLFKGLVPHILQLPTSIFDHLYCNTLKACVSENTTFPFPSAKRLRGSLKSQIVGLPPLAMCLTNRLSWGRSMTGWPSRDAWIWQTFIRSCEYAIQRWLERYVGPWKQKILYQSACQWPAKGSVCFTNLYHLYLYSVYIWICIYI